MAEEQTTAQAAHGEVRTPPYIAFKTFLTFMEDLKAHGLPPQIDRSVIKRFSGGVGSQLLMGVRSLHLIDDSKRPTSFLAQLHKSFGTDQFKPDLEVVLRHAYPFLNKIDLRTATPSMFADAFSSGTNAKTDVLKKCRRFFLQAAEYSGMEIGPRLAAGSHSVSNGSAAPARKRAVKTPRPDSQTPEKESHRRNKIQNTPTSSMVDKLLDKFPKLDPNWPDDIKAKWFEGFQKLMTSVGDNEGGKNS
jgi:hypothetical protein